MRAAVHTRYGPPEVVRVEEVPDHVPGDRDLLIRVRSTSVNRTDASFRDPEPFFVRLFSGLRRPRIRILGNEFAGEVAAVGQEVTAFAPGDEVMGLSPDRFGAHAELIRLRESAKLARKPAGVAFEEAGAGCDGGMAALTCMRRGGVGSGTRLMVYGATGAIGTAAVQLGKHLGAKVTAVCDTSRVELVRSLGADEVIDYTREDFTPPGRTWDVIFDSVGKTSFRRCRRALAKGGTFVETDLGFMWHVPFLALWTRAFGSRRVTLPIPRIKPEDIALLGRLMASGELRVVIDRRYPLDRIVEAHAYVDTGQKTGNVVVTVDRGAEVG
jgi:NADPH:quinone reductase-like Zn-dependent oxidoreductase